MSQYQPFPGEFSIDSTWNALVALLTSQLGDVDVDAIGDKDFDEQGDLTVKPPAARVAFIDEQSGKPVETQNQVYNTEQSFAVLCAVEDLRGVQEQRLASLGLAARVKHVAVGARLALSDGTQTEPIVYCGLQLLPTKSIGMACVVKLCVPNIAQFAAPNAYPQVANPGGN